MNGWSDLAVSLLSGGRRDSNDISRVRVCGLPGRCGLWRLATACATLAGPDGCVFFRSPPPPAERMAASYGRERRVAVAHTLCRARGQYGGGVGMRWHVVAKIGILIILYPVTVIRPRFYDCKLRLKTARPGTARRRVSPILSTTNDVLYLLYLTLALQPAPAVRCACPCAPAGRGRAPPPARLTTQTLLSPARCTQPIAAAHQRSGAADQASARAAHRRCRRG